MKAAKKPSKKKGIELTGRGWKLILCFVVVVCAAVITVILLIGRNETPDGALETYVPGANVPLAGGNLVVNENNLKEIEEEINKKVAQGRFVTHMTMTWTFPNGRSASTNAVMGNSVNNNYPFWFEVQLADTKEVIYTSSLLPVGSQLAELKLDKPLEKGEYSAVVYIHMIDENNEPVESNMGFNIDLVVKN